MTNYDLGYTFEKFSFFIDICHDKFYPDLDSDEVMSIFMSNFDGEELMQFREAQNGI